MVSDYACRRVGDRRCPWRGGSRREVKRLHRPWLGAKNITRGVYKGGEI